ncbi:MAG: cell division protein FtsA [Flammeovirgaceae bacterium]|jgi:cell division protein FtsA|nr:cell division protein FtsA [Flammeovirgaceae bacterium]
MTDKSKNFFTALDIGTSKICAIIAEKTENNKLKIIGFSETESEGVSEGMIQNLIKATAKIKEVVLKASEMANLKIKFVNVGIAGKHIRSFSTHHSIGLQNNENEPIEINQSHVKKLEQRSKMAVIPTNHKIIHSMPQKYTIDEDHESVDPIGEFGKKLEADFHIISANKVDIKIMEESIRRSDIICRNLILEPIASSIALLDENDKEDGICLVDIGGGTTDISIFHDNIIRHTAVIPLGGDIVTQDIKEGLGLPRNHAEALKIKFGKALYVKRPVKEFVKIKGEGQREDKKISLDNLYKIIEARMEEIFDKVHQEILNSGMSEKLSAGIVITGGGSQLLNLKQQVKYITGLDVRKGFPNSYLTKSEIVNLEFPKYSTSVGLLLWEFANENKQPENNFKTASSLPRVNNFGKLVTERIKGFLKDDDLTEFKDESL